MSGAEWVLPEKYEEGLLDEKGEPLSKRQVHVCIDGRAPERSSVACCLHRGDGGLPGLLASAPRSEFKRRQKLAQKEKEMAEKKVRFMLLPLRPPAAACLVPPASGGLSRPSWDVLCLFASHLENTCCQCLLSSNHRCPPSTPSSAHALARLRPRLQAKQAAEAAARAAAKAAKGDAAAALEDDSNEETDPTK